MRDYGFTLCDEELPDEFWAKVRVDGECWLWFGAKSEGYGQWRKQYTHRVVYEAAVGPIPSNKQVDHLCRIRSCCNPQHLELVTQRENIRRGDAGKANREKTHCPRGHEYTRENTYRPPDGGRRCRECRK